MTKKTDIMAGITAVAVAAGLFVAPMAEAQGRDGGRGGMSFSQLDTDGSGGITAAELEALAKTRFAQLDANGDGKVTAEEMTARAQGQASERMAQRSAQMIERMDLNGDGALSEDEMHGGRGGNAGMLQRADSNGDGIITEAEFDAAMAEMKQRGKGGGRRGG